MEGHVSERGAEVVVEEALEDVERDVGQAGVNVGVDGQDDGVRPDDAARHDVALATKKQKKHHTKSRRRRRHFIDRQHYITV